MLLPTLNAFNLSIYWLTSRSSIPDLYVMQCVYITTLSSDSPMSKSRPTPNIDEFSSNKECNYLGQTIADIIRRESLHELATEKYMCWQTADGRQVFGDETDDQHLLRFMPKLQQLYARIMAADELTTEPVFIRWAKRPGFKLTALGRSVLDVCMYFAAEEDAGRNWQQAYAHHKFHPIVAVMLRAVMRWWQPICSWGEPLRSLIQGEPAAESVESLQSFVDFVRRACRSQAFQNLLHDHESKAEDNFRSGCDYLTSLFEQHSRLLILRIDLYFRPDAKGWGYGKAADEAVTKYLRSLRLAYGPGYFGFVIKRENGISRGMHYHLMVILDGNLHRNAYYLTQQMGEKWIKRVGTDKGSFFNSYARKDRYRYNGLGLVHVSDVEKLLGLRIALWYMSKQDSELKVDDSKVKNFWRTPTREEADPRGAPRKNGDGMALVKRQLGGERSKYPPGFEPPKQERAMRNRSSSAVALLVEHGNVPQAGVQSQGL